jgi:hypothetical protein
MQRVSSVVALLQGLERALNECARGGRVEANVPRSVGDEARERASDADGTEVIH